MDTRITSQGKNEAFRWWDGANGKNIEQDIE